MAPPWPTVGVGALLFDDEGRVLLVKRGHDPGRGKWSIPGGVLRPGEGLFEAARRELREETGLEAEPIGIVGVAEYLELASGGVRYHYVIIDVLFQGPVKGVLKASSDALDAGFYDLEEALRALELTNTTRMFLERLVRNEKCIHSIISYKAKGA